MAKAKNGTWRTIAGGLAAVLLAALTIYAPFVRDTLIDHGQAIVKNDTSLVFIRESLKRIEDKLDRLGG